MPTLRHEINILNQTAGGASGIVLGADGWARLDPPRMFSGTCTYYFEALITTASGGATLALQDATASERVSISAAATGLVRSAAFTTTGQNIYGIYSANTTIRVKSARIIVIETGAVHKTSSQVELGAVQATTSTTLVGLTAPKYWKCPSSSLGLVGQISASMKLAGTKGTGTLELQVADGTGDGFAGWASVTGQSITGSYTSVSLVTSSYFCALIPGRNYRIAIKTSNSKSAFTVYGASLLVLGLSPLLGATTLGASDPSETDIIADASYAYTCTNEPGGTATRVTRISLTDYSKTTKVLATTESNASAICHDDTYVYVAAENNAGVTGKMIRILKSDWTTSNTLDLTSYGPRFCCAQSTDHVFAFFFDAGLTRRIVRVLKSDWTTYSAADPGGSVASMTTDSTYLYYVLSTSPAEVHRVPLSSWPSGVSSKVLQSGFTDPGKIAQDANYVYCIDKPAGEDGTIARIHKSDWTTVDYVTTTGYRLGGGVFSSGSAIYVSAGVANSDNDLILILSNEHWPNYRVASFHGFYLGGNSSSLVGAFWFDMTVRSLNNFAATPPLLPEQYLLNNATAAAGTAFQNALTTWDPNEWAGVSNSYTACADAANGSTSVITIQEADGGSTLGTVTSPDNQGFGTALIDMPAGQALDSKLTTNNGDVYATKLVVECKLGVANDNYGNVASDAHVNRQAVNRGSTY